MKKRFLFLVLSSASSLFYGYGMEEHPVLPPAYNVLNQPQQEPILHTEEEIKKCHIALRLLSMGVKSGNYTAASKTLNDNEELFSSFSAEDYESGAFTEPFSALKNLLNTCEWKAENEVVATMTMHRLADTFGNPVETIFKERAKKCLESIMPTLKAAYELKKVLHKNNFAKELPEVAPVFRSLLSKAMTPTMPVFLDYYSPTSIENPELRALMSLFTTYTSSYPYLAFERVKDSVQFAINNEWSANQEKEWLLRPLYSFYMDCLTVNDLLSNQKFVEDYAKISLKSSFKDFDVKHQIRIAMTLFYSSKDENSKGYINALFAYVFSTKCDPQDSIDFTSHFPALYAQMSQSEVPLREFYNHFPEFMEKEIMFYNSMKKNHTAKEAFTKIIERQKQEQNFYHEFSFKTFDENIKNYEKYNEIINAMERSSGANSVVLPFIPYSKALKERFLQQSQENLKTLSLAINERTDSIINEYVKNDELKNLLFVMSKFSEVLALDFSELEFSAKIHTEKISWENVAKFLNVYCMELISEGINPLGLIPKENTLDGLNYMKLLSFFNKKINSHDFQDLVAKENNYIINQWLHHWSIFYQSSVNFQIAYETPHIDLFQEEMKEAKLPSKKKNKNNKKIETEEERNVRIQKVQEERALKQKEEALAQEKALLERTNNRVVAYDNLIAKEDAYTKALEKKHEILGGLLAKENISEREKNKFFRDYQGLKWSAFNDYKKPENIKPLESVEQAEEFLGKTYETYKEISKKRIALEKEIECSINKLKSSNNPVIHIEESKPQQPWMISCDLMTREKTDLIVCGLMEQYGDIINTLEKNGIPLSGEKRIVGSLYSYYSETFAADVLGKKIVAIHFCGAERYQYTTRIYFEVVGDKKLSYLGIGHYENSTGNIVKTW